MVNLPRFTENEIRAQYLRQNIGITFQDFVVDILKKDYPGLVGFLGAGKDGAIDALQTCADDRTVVECKYVGDDGVESAQASWRKVAKHLRQNLADPAGPPSGQAQYNPWYRQDKPIVEHIFAISAALSNARQLDDLNDEIKGTFNTLVAQHGHLSHLKDIRVRVVDWNQLADMLCRSDLKHLIFKWFKNSCPPGIEILGEAYFAGTFRSYLSDSKLPYYSRAEHLRTHPAPHGRTIWKEQKMIDLLENPAMTGIMLTGIGGIGKTRLALQLGLLAADQGWLVYRILGNIRFDSFDDFLSQFTPQDRVVFFVDYIETTGAFEQIEERMAELNDSLGLHLRYIATCRTAYYHRTFAAAAPHQHRIDLSEEIDDKSVDRWIQQYRKAAVHHIITRSGLPPDEGYLRVCHDLPVLAVFISYLHAKGQGDDLAALREEPDFGTWLAKRLRMSFADRAMENDELARTVAQLPFPAGTAANLSNGRLEIFHRLAADGWILQTDCPIGDGTWEMAHDVLADQIFIAYCRTILRTVSTFLTSLFRESCRMGTLSGVLIALQRVAADSALLKIDWLSLIENEMTECPDAWRDVRDLILRTTLLESPDKFTLLQRHGEIWEGAEKELAFHHQLGWHIRQLLRWKEKTGVEIPEITLSTIDEWLQKSLPFETHNNYLLRWALLCRPAVVRDKALAWIQSNPLQHQTHFLIAAWLKTGSDIVAIQAYVSVWLNRFQGNPSASFVFSAWLKADGDKTVIQPHLETWLKQHETDAEASHVYAAWLNAKGDIATVQSHVEAWLKQHETDAEAQFVYAAWLDAKGDIATVQSHVEAWLKQHET
ncbi:hypothetical protein KJ815_00965, partial [bacterium]|nr:hypothetical protein [bacterium]